VNTNQPKQEKYIWVPLAIICFFMQIFSLAAKEIDADYDDSLERALYYMANQKLNIAKQKLEKLQVDYENLDYRFYTIKGELYLKLDQVDEAIEAFEISSRMSSAQKIDQPLVAKKLYELYLNSRKLHKAFDYIRLYLAQNPGDKKARYDSLVLSSRLGKLNYFNAVSSRFLKDLKDSEKKIPDIEKWIQKKEYKKAFELASEEILKNPMNPKLHGLKRIAQNSLDSKSDEMENVLLGMAAIFFQEKKYSLLLGNFYKLQNRKFQAINLYRRMFSQSLKSDKYEFDEEVLYLIRDSYYELGRTKDAFAISELIQMCRRGDHQIEEDLWNAYKLSYNREILVFLIFHVREKKQNESLEKYLKVLKAHDQKYGDSEFMNIFPVFDYPEES
jgi:tetratricopeptide (TPR) repeat protein